MDFRNPETSAFLTAFSPDARRVAVYGVDEYHRVRSLNAVGVQGPHADWNGSAPNRV